MSSSQTRRPRPKKNTPRRPGDSSSRTPIVVFAVVGLIVIALIVAVFAGGGDDDDSTATSPGPAPANALAPLPESGEDPAVGAEMPTLTGTTQDGDPMTIEADGRAKMIMFVAHWCPHCTNEVPVVQDWVDDGNLPADVDLVAVSTAIDSRRPNYPPEKWLDSEGWSSPVLVDADNSAAQTAGLSAFPFFVAVDADGDVVTRTTGELPASQLTEIADMLTQEGRS